MDWRKSGKYVFSQWPLSGQRTAASLVPRSQVTEVAVNKRGQVTGYRILLRFGGREGPPKAQVISGNIIIFNYYQK